MAVRLWLRTHTLHGGGPFIRETAMPSAFIGPEPPVTVIDVYQPWAVRVEGDEVTIVDPDWVVTEWYGDAL